MAVENKDKRITLDKIKEGFRKVGRVLFLSYIAISFMYVGSLTLTSAKHGFDLHQGHFFGYVVTPMTGDSMLPTFYSPIDITILKKVPYEDLRIGDVIVYQIEWVEGSGEIEAISHRIVGVHPDGLILKGDGNLMLDPHLVKEEHYRGRLEYTLKGGKFVDIDTVADEFLTERFDLLNKDRRTCVEELEDYYTRSKP